LTTKDEILYNSIWRFLHLQEYIDSNHRLTPWGEVLATTIAALNGKPELEEAAIIAIELARLNLLNAKNMFNYGGAPMRGTGKILLARWQDESRRTNILQISTAETTYLSHVLLVLAISVTNRSASLVLSVDTCSHIIRWSRLSAALFAT
jgi:hypothetical protein